EICAFIDFWTKAHGQRPRHLVFDSKLTTQANLVRLHRELHINCSTVRRRAPKLLKEVYGLPRSAWRQVELDARSGHFRAPRLYDQRVKLEGHFFRRIFALDLGHDKPTILLTNQHHTAVQTLLTRYAHRMLIENSLSDAVRF